MKLLIEHAGSKLPTASSNSCLARAEPFFVKSIPGCIEGRVDVIVIDWMLNHYQQEMKFITPGGVHVEVRVLI